MTARVVWSWPRVLVAVMDLTPTQRQIAFMLAKGMTNAAIADCLSVERETVKNHATDIYRAFGLTGTQYGHPQQQRPQLVTIMHCAAQAIRQWEIQRHAW